MLLLTETQKFWVLGLLVVWAGLLFGGFAFGKLNADETHRIRRWMRMASSFTLVVIAWSIYLFFRDAGTATLTLFFALGMTLGFVGDLFMAQLIIKGENFVLGGIGAFSICHILYIRGLLSFATVNIALLFWLIFGVLGWFFVVYYRSERTVMHVAALPYTLLLSTTAGIATSLALVSSAFIPVAIGATLFLLSDLLLAAQLFRGLHFRYIGDVVWFMYGPGQMLIVCGLVL